MSLSPRLKKWWKMSDLGEIIDDRSKILKILEPMMVDFKRAINEMRAEGASRIEVEAMLEELEARYASAGDAEGELVLAVLREAACSLYPSGAVGPL
jgi:hypothetical protein